MPGPSVWPLLAALFTAGFFLLLTVQAYIPAVISGILAIPSVLRWLWETDRPIATERVDIGGGIVLPTYVTGPSTHGWWATVILLIVILMIFVMAVFSFVFLYGLHPSYWTAPDNQWWLLPILGGYGAAIGLALLGRWLLAREKSTHWSPTSQLIFAAVAASAAFACDWMSWTDLDPELSGQNAVIMAFLALQGILIAIVLLMIFYLALRTARGLVTRPRNVTFDVIFLFILYTSGQGAISALLTHLFPGGI